MPSPPIPSGPPSSPLPKPVEAARHICEEARVVLSSLRGGPPAVSRGELAADLRDLRLLVRGRFLDPPPPGSEAAGPSEPPPGHFPGSYSEGYGPDDAGAVVEAATETANAAPEETAGHGGQDADLPPGDDGGDDEAEAEGGSVSPAVPAGGVGPAATVGGGSFHLPSHPTPHGVMPRKSLPPPPEEAPASPSGSEVLVEGPDRSSEAAVAGEEGGEPASGGGASYPNEPPPSPMEPTSKFCKPVLDASIECFGNSPPAFPFSAGVGGSQRTGQSGNEDDGDVGPYARPFLAVVVDPRAAGPHTLVALRALHRLLERGSLVRLGGYGSGNGGGPYRDDDGTKTTATSSSMAMVHEVALEPLMRGVLACKFEQTDAGADEAVEMAIADLLSLLVDLDASSPSNAGGVGGKAGGRKIRPETLMEAFNTVFVTRNTFVHSPALCYHFEVVLTGMVEAAFGKLTPAADASRTSPVGTTATSSSHAKATPAKKGKPEHRRNSYTGLRVSSDRSSSGGGGGDAGIRTASARLILEFLANQMLHTPILPGQGGTSGSAGGSGAGGDLAHAAHDATRVLCLRLVRVCLRTGWGDEEHALSEEEPYRRGIGGGGFGARFGPPAEEADDDDLDGDRPDEEDDPDDEGGATDEDFTAAWEERTILRIIQDDLCLSLLMTGQAIWSYHDSHSSVSPPGIISLEVLSEICATLSALWHITKLRAHLTSQFESIFSGFYQRALALLRRRPVPEDTATFHANLAFDAEVEIILESLVDLLCLHDDRGPRFDGGGGGDDPARAGGALETLFATYDCDMTRSDVSSGLVVELCRCCGGTVGEDGEVVLDPKSDLNSEAGTGTATPQSGVDDAGTTAQLQQQLHSHRHVPAHLKELCAEALMGGMKCLFRDGSSTSSDNAAMVPPSTAGGAARAGKVVVASGADANRGAPPPGDEAPADLGSSSVHDAEAAPALPRQHSLTGAQTFDDGAGPSRTSLRYVKSQKKLMRRAAALFNQKSTLGIRYLADNGVIPTPVTPASVASFLRGGIVVGLDKKAVGEYLGEVGKAPVAGKSPPVWERNFFHSEALSLYCGLFRFENQSLLDGLRMFLAAFRLPGEAQQIDRILQAFAESCGRSCEESVRLKLFSDDPKKASDAAYLLSFSIIMLNTDQHNDNIRADRKMTVEDFVRNNTDYGRDITDEGKALPRDYLEGIYESIREEQIRTEGEGAEGVMTVERWKDVLRGGTTGSSAKENSPPPPSPGASEVADRHDLKELVLENVYMPVLSAVGGFWSAGIHPLPAAYAAATESQRSSGMHGAQGARLGMDLAVEMLAGVRNLGRTDVFRTMFRTVCAYTGLLGSYNADAVDRTTSFVHSVERQSAVIVALNTAKDAGDCIGIDGWKEVWSMILELRDLKLLGGWKGGSRAASRRSLLVESDPDMLTENARREWNMRLAKGGLDDADGGAGSKNTPKKTMSYMFGAMGRALFGSDEGPADATRSASRSGASVGSDGDVGDPDESNPKGLASVVKTVHGKEELLIWDDLAPSDDEDEDAEGFGDEELDGDAPAVGGTPGASSAGAAFESQLLHEDNLVYHHILDDHTPVTGLETVEDTRAYSISPRARVRKRLGKVCDFESLVSDSRFLDMDGVMDLLGALLDVVKRGGGAVGHDPTEEPGAGIGLSPRWPVSADPSVFAISPASEALAEVLICEIALRNRDRIGTLWDAMLKDHYSIRLGNHIDRHPPTSDRQHSDSAIPQQQRNVSFAMIPGMEKCVTGLLRVCAFTVHREHEVSTDVLSSLQYLYPPMAGLRWSSSLSSRLNLDRHMSEGLWRICRNVDGLHQIEPRGWDGLLGLVRHCAMRGGSATSSLRGGRSGGLAEDDPALQAFRSLHLVLHAPELKESVPFGVAGPVRALVEGGERGNCPKLSVAGLDLLLLLHTRLEVLIAKEAAMESHGEERKDPSENDGEVWFKCWLPVLEGVAEAAEMSRYASVRQHALSMLTDAIIDRHGRAVSDRDLCHIVRHTCVALAGKRMSALLCAGNSANFADHWEETMIELELCISLVFKPLLHHLKTLITVEEEFAPLWSSVLSVMSQLLGDCGQNTPPGQGDDQRQHHPLEQDRAMTRDKLLLATKELGSEHLRNAVMVLIACGVLSGEDPGSSETKVRGEDDDFSSRTWASIANMEFCRDRVGEWRQSAVVQCVADVGGAGVGTHSGDSPGKDALNDTSVPEDGLETDGTVLVSEGGENTCEVGPS